MDLFLNYSGIKQLSDADLSSERYQRASRLYLKRNLLRELPLSIGQLTALTQLHVVANALQGLPEEVGELKNLEILDVAENSIAALPRAIGRLEKLKRLSVGGNKIACLPKEVGCLKHLVSLEASRNLLPSVPVELSRCESLSVLALDKNLLTCVPRQLGRLQKLTELSLCSNFIENIPQSYSQLSSLMSLYMDNNPGLSHFTHPFNFSRYRCLGLNGCFLSCAYSPLCERFLHIPSADGHIAIPEEIKHICKGCDGGPTPPLYELALRTVSGCVNKDQDVEQLPLPEVTKESLRDPTAVCVKCSVDLFTFACVDIYYISFPPANGRLSILSLCCSQKCLRQFMQGR